MLNIHVRGPLYWPLLLAIVCALVPVAVPARADTGARQAEITESVINDDFVNALPVTAIPYSNTQDVIDATTAADDPILPCSSGQRYNSVWYRYTPLADDTLLISTGSSSYSTVTAVWTGARGSLTNQACSDAPQLEVTVSAGTTYHIEVVRRADDIYPAPTSLDLVFAVWPADTPPGAFGKLAPADGSAYQTTRPRLSWDASDYAAGYAYCHDTSDNDSCDTAWTTTTKTSVDLSGLSMGTTYYWQVRATNSAASSYADGEEWWSFTTASAADLNHWSGTVGGTSRPMSFDVLTSGTQWLYFTVLIPYSGCSSSGTATVVAGGPGTITGNRFGYSSASLSFSGTFPTRTTASGYFSLVNYPVCVWKQPGYCCWALTSGSGTWAASGPPLTAVQMLYLPLVARNYGP